MAIVLFAFSTDLSLVAGDIFLVNIIFGATCGAVFRFDIRDFLAMSYTLRHVIEL